MPLTMEDKDWFKDLMAEQKQDLEKSFKQATSETGKRVSRLEHAFSLVSRAARSCIVERAKEKHATLLRCMFDDGDLLLIPPFEGGQRKVVTCEMNDVRAMVKKYAEGYDVELNRQYGFRLVHGSRSAQVRRKAAAGLLKKMKKEALQELGLVMQYDKPFELRTMQSTAHKFLGGIKKGGGSLISSTKVHSGFLLANEVRIAPEYLVPHQHRWEQLQQLVLAKVCSWGSRTPTSSDMGVMTDVFGAEFAADQGVFELEALPLADYGGSDDEDMHEPAAVAGNGR
jgi:hypothetical protein